MSDKSGTTSGVGSEGTAFLCSFSVAMGRGLDYRTYEKCFKLPVDVELVAVAGVWGDFAQVRCLFVDRAGRKYRRHIQQSKDAYVIRELGLCAKEITVGAVYVVSAEGT